MQRSRSFIATNRFFICNLIPNFCSRTHRLATTHNVTDDRRRRRRWQTDATVYQ